MLKKKNWFLSQGKELKVLYFYEILFFFGTKLSKNSTFSSF